MTCAVAAVAWGLPAAARAAMFQTASLKVPELRVPADILAAAAPPPRKVAKARIVKVAQAMPAPPPPLSSPARPASVKAAPVPVAAPPPSRGADIDVPLIVNDLQAGSVRVHVDPSQAKSFDYKAVMAIVGPGLSPQAVAELDAVAGGRAFVPFQQTQGLKVPIRFDEDQLAVVVTIAPAYTRIHPVDLRPQYRSPSAEVVKPAVVSAYLNVRANAGYLEGPGGGMEPLQLDLDGAANIDGYVLEGRADYYSGNDLQSWAMNVEQSPRWQRGDVRLVHDDVGDMLRFAAGDLSYPVTGFQSFQSMAGFSVAKNFTLQPYNVFKPTGQSSILLTSPSQVQVYVNGNLDRVMHLPAGNYSLSDFPVVDGVNDVHLLITDASGRVEAETLSVFTDDNLLKQGVSAFAYNIGVPSTITNGRIWYGRNLTFSGFESYGISDRLTLGGNLQGDTDQQMAGATTVYEMPIGNVQVDAAVSHDRTYGNGGSAQVQYSYTDSRLRNFNLALSYRDAYFQPLGTRGRAADHYTAAIRYGQNILGGVQASIGARVVDERAPIEAASSSQVAWNANFSKAFSRSLALNVTLGGGAGEAVNAFVSLSWVPGRPNGDRSQQSGNFSYDSTSDAVRADWNYNANRAGNSIDAQLSAVSFGDKTGLGGSADFTTYRYEGYLARVVNSDGTIEDQARFGTAIVFADGHLALSRPVSDSFALIYPHEDLRSYDIGVNPSVYNANDVTFATVASKWGAGVLPDMESYYDRPVTIDTRHVPAGFDVGASQLVLAPTYKSGVIVEVGTGADAYVRGRLVMAGQALALASGMVTGPRGYARQIFTDRNGVFYAYGLSRGAYTLTLPGAQAPLNFTVAAAKGKMFDLGTLDVLPAKDPVSRP